MKLITRDTDYAIRALVYIAGSEGDLTSVSQLIKELDMPRPFLRKILQVLQKEGILESAKGYQGGFALKLPENRIYLFDLVEIFQGNFKLLDCVFRKESCTRQSKCSLRRELLSIENFAIKKLKSITIADLLKP